MSTNNNKRLLHRKEWQLMTPCPSVAGSAVLFIGDDSTRNRFTFCYASTSTHYLYDHEEDAWILLPASGMAGSLTNGACGQYFPWSTDMRAVSGTTTTIVCSAATYNLTRFIKGCTIEFVSGTNAGRTAVITDMINDGANCTIYLGSTLPNAVTNEFFRINSGRFFILNGYTTSSANCFRSFDVATMSWSAALSVTNLPATSWGTDGAMTTPYQFNNAFISGTASAGATATLTDSTANWTVNNFTNYQVKIVSGTGIGQIRRIASNTATALTVATNWTVNPAAGSQYVIEAAEDLYLVGNGGSALYRYTIPSTMAGTIEAWTSTLASATNSLGTGCTLDAIVGATESNWTNPNNLLNGRYLYSFRGAGTGTLQRYDIPTNAWITYGSGVANYGPFSETFSTGSCGMAYASRIYIRKDGTNRFFYYDVVANDLVPFSTNLYTDSSAIVGQKIWIKKYDDQTMWLYSMRNQDVPLHRIMMF